MKKKVNPGRVSGTAVFNVFFYIYTPMTIVDTNVTHFTFGLNDSNFHKKFIIAG